MYRMLIVDDEPAIVAGLLVVFTEYQQEELELYSACSSADALRLAGDVDMDIVLTDIHMPVMNGLELSEKIAGISPRTKFIFLTGFNEFDYIYQAMSRLGNQYVLKSEDDDKIVECVEKAIAMLCSEMEQKVAGYQAELAERKYRSQVKKAALIRLLEDQELQNEELMKRKVNISVNDEVYLFAGSLLFEQPVDWMDALESMYHLKFLADDRFMQEFATESFQYSDHDIVWLLKCRNTDMDIKASYFEMRAEELQRFAASAMNASLSVGFTTDTLVLSKVASSYRDISTFLHSNEVKGIPVILNLTDYKAESGGLQDNLIAALEEYITINIDENITLTALGDRLHYNPSYLSRYYKKMTGRNLSKFILEKKIDRARKMLSESDAKVNDIAAFLGFDSPSYFCAVFRKATGKSPAEYRLCETVYRNGK